MPDDHLRRRLETRDVDLLAVSCTVPVNLSGAAKCVAAAHAVGLPVLVGGRAFAGRTQRADAIGADGLVLAPHDLVDPRPAVGDHAPLPEEALRLDAVAVCVNLMQIPDHPEVREANIRSIMALRREATRYGMPLMIEPLVMQDNTTAGGYQVDGDIEKIVTLVRQAVELGADLIKADPSSDITEYARVVQVAGDIVRTRQLPEAPDRTIG